MKNDLISRQAAIDIAVFECGEWTGLAKEISEQLKQLPSAQPEPTFEQIKEYCDRRCMTIITNDLYYNLTAIYSTRPKITHCRDCKHQIKDFHEDKRRKDGGYYVYGCELADDYSHVCLDDDFCSKGER